MTRTVINTERIADTATAIVTADDNINNAFTELKQIAVKMDNSWNSAAGTTAIDLFNKIIQGNESRSAVLRSYANILHQAVNPNYELSERENVTLSDQFL